MSLLIKDYMSRRQMMIGGAALLWPTIPTPAVAQVVTRPSHKSAGPALASYKKAVKAMLELPPSDPHNWYRQAYVHLIECPHGSPFFFPWHRAYIRHFEQLCRKYSADPSFNLPFWDWTDEQAIPSVFFEDFLNPGHTGFEPDFASFKAKHSQALQTFWNTMSAAQKTRATSRFASADAVMTEIETAPHFLPRASARDKTTATRAFDSFLKQDTGVASMTDIIATSNFESFSALTEGPHGSVHVAGVGGFMSAFVSPVDPIFWLHHANVDRLWHIWSQRQKRLGCSAQPITPGWNDNTFLFFTNAAGQTLTDTAGQYLDVAPFGYTYATGSLSDLATTGGQPCQPSPTLRSLGVANAAGANVFRVARETSLALDIPAEIFRGAQSRGPAAVGTPRAERLIARITVKVPAKTTGKRLKVFMNCPYLNASTPATDPHYVGSYAFFGAGHGDHAHGADERLVTFSLPINSAISRLPLSRPNDKTLKFQIISEGPGAFGTSLDATLKSVEVVRV